MVLQCVRPFHTPHQLSGGHHLFLLVHSAGGLPSLPRSSPCRAHRARSTLPWTWPQPLLSLLNVAKTSGSSLLRNGAVIFTCQDPPSPSRYGFPPRAAPALALHSPRVLSPPRALLDSPHHHLPGSPHDGHRAGRALLDSPHHHLPSSPHHVGGHHLVGVAGSPHHAAGHHLASTSPHPQRVMSAPDSPRRYIGSPMRVASRTHSPDLHREAASPINLHNFHR